MQDNAHAQSSSSAERSESRAARTRAWGKHAPRRLWETGLDLASASYFATEWHDEVLNPESKTILQVVVKTRGKTQYYQNQDTFEFNLTYHDLANRKRPMVNSTREMSELEAAGLNRALSIRRKTVGGFIIVFIGVILDAAGVDISILT